MLRKIGEKWNAQGFKGFSFFQILKINSNPLPVASKVFPRPMVKFETARTLLLARKTRLPYARPKKRTPL
ncbi:MAG: hypothetical protein ABUL66_01090 [Verrucomicrobiota bacterium]